MNETEQTGASGGATTTSGATDATDAQTRPAGQQTPATGTTGAGASGTTGGAAVSTRRAQGGARGGARENATAGAAFATLGATFAQYFNEQLKRIPRAPKITHERRQWTVAGIDEQGLRITDGPNAELHVEPTVEQLRELLSLLGHF